MRSRKDLIKDETCWQLPNSAKAIEAYETWRNSFIQALEFGPSALPPSYGRYGFTLAIIECASRSKDPEELALVNQLSNELVESHANWSQSGSFARHVQDRSDRSLSIRNSVGARIALATFAGLAFIFPMLIMVLDQTIASHLCVCSSSIGSQYLGMIDWLGSRLSLSSHSLWDGCWLFGWKICEVPLLLPWRRHMQRYWCFLWVPEFER